MEPDGELLRRYVENGSEAAFAALVQRHINLVYRYALRRVGGNAHAADDVVQSVFSDLARKAPSLLGRNSLAGWLYTGARFAAAEIVRSEQRRRTHEQEAHQMNELNAPDVDATRLEPLLDEVLDTLRDREREAIVLHFFERLTFGEVGAIQALSADAARMRVNRALTRIRSVLERRGIESGAAALAAALSAQSAAAAGVPMSSVVADTAIRQAGKVVARPMPWSARWLRVTAGVGIAVSAIWGVARWRAGRSVSPAPSVAGTASGGSSATQEAVTTSSQVEAPAAAADARGSRTTPAESAALSAQAQNLLKRLWRIQQTTYGGFSGNIGITLKSGEGGDVSAREELASENLARVMTGVRGNDALMLSRKGVAYCERLFDEWPASPPITPAEKAFLMQLWTIEEQNSHAARGVNYGIVLAPEEVMANGYGRLLAKGWIARGPHGAVYLTKAGKAFLEAHAGSVVAAQAP